MSRKIKLIAVVLALAFAMAAPGAAFAERAAAEGADEAMYFADEVMALAGYRPAGPNAYEQALYDGLNVSVTFDPESGVCMKNNYRFDLSDRIAVSDSKLLLSAGAIVELLN